MCQSSNARTSCKSEVTRVDCDPACKGTGALWFVNIHQGKRLSTYWVSPLVSDWGIAARFEASRTEAASAMQADHYDVLIENAQDCSCTCPGFLRWGRCKHTAALAVLIERGVLGRPALHDDACPCEGCERLREYKPGGSHDHGIPF